MRWPLTPREEQQHGVGSVRCCDGSSRRVASVVAVGGHQWQLRRAHKSPGMLPGKRAPRHLSSDASKGQCGLGKLSYMWATRLNVSVFFSPSVFDAFWFPGTWFLTVCTVCWALLPLTTLRFSRGGFHLSFSISDCKSFSFGCCFICVTLSTTSDPRQDVLGVGRWTAERQCLIYFDRQENIWNFKNVFLKFLL